MTSSKQTRLICVGISRWKRSALRAMLEQDYSSITFTRSSARALKQAERLNGALAVWASHNNSHLIAGAKAKNIPVIRIEDGFLRSVGLGAAFTCPCSLVADCQGIYYDPRTASDLENTLFKNEFSDDILAQAEQLHSMLKKLDVTKYNTGITNRTRISPPHMYAVLVPGQVEDDASIRYGSTVINTNLQLLKAARERHPDAFIIFKPHPDVAAGYRMGSIAEHEAHGLADSIVTDRSITDLYNECTHIETMSSLAGFEGLLRGLKVTTHGQPFYSGWGLTEDLQPHPRRGVSRSLNALIAATLLIYPRYIHPLTGERCTAEEALTALAAASNRQSGITQQWQHLYALCRHRAFGFFDRRRRQ